MRLHGLGKRLCGHLSKELRQKHRFRSIRLRRGDLVKVMRGKFRGRTGRIEAVDLRTCRVYVSGIEITRRDGKKVLVGLAPSKLLVLELAHDPRRL